MGYSYLLATDAPISDFEFIVWVVREGGVRVSDRPPEARFDGEWSHVWLWPDNEPRELEPEDIEKLAAVLGAEPNLFVVIEAGGHAEKGERVLLEVVTRFLSTWHGCVQIDPDVILTLADVQKLIDEGSTLGAVAGRSRTTGRNEPAADEPGKAPAGKPEPAKGNSDKGKK